jgi:hypothetical protein
LEWKETEATVWGIYFQINSNCVPRSPRMTRGVRSPCVLAGRPGCQCRLQVDGDGERRTLSRLANWQVETTAPGSSGPQLLPEHWPTLSVKKERPLHGRIHILLQLGVKMKLKTNFVHPLKPFFGNLFSSIRTGPNDLDPKYAFKRLFRSYVKYELSTP